MSLSRILKICNQVVKQTIVIAILALNVEPVVSIYKYYITSSIFLLRDSSRGGDQNINFL